MSSDSEYSQKYPIAYWDWRAWSKDEGIRSTSLGARGLWFELLGCMRKWRNYGVLCTRAGFPMKLGEISELVNAPVHQIKPLLDELEKAGVFSRSKRGAIYCRRMKREAPVIGTIGQLASNGGVTLPPPSLPLPFPPYTPLPLPNPAPLLSSHKEHIQVKKQLGKIIRPLLQQVYDFGRTINTTEAVCNKFYTYYSNSNWKNKYGKDIDWKQSLRSWSAQSPQIKHKSQCESPRSRFEDCEEQATIALNHARNETLAVMMMALATFSKPTIELALAHLNDKELSVRVKEAYVKMSAGQKA
jgi:hypothetical protein